MVNSNLGLSIWKQGKERKRQWNVFPKLLALLDVEEEMQSLEQRAVCQNWDKAEQSKEAWPAVPSQHKILAVSHDVSFGRADVPTKKSHSLDPRKDGNVSPLFFFALEVGL